jgi:hypothetical protein
MHVFLLYTGLLALSVVGCGGSLEAQSGPDAYRDQAAPAILNAWVPDAISRSEEDATDWKSFQVSTETPVTIQVKFGDPAVAARVSLHDIHGIPVAAKNKRKGDPAALLLAGTVPAGLNFIQIHCTGGSDASEYAIQIALGDSSGTPPRPF